jgi:hypothetical protein
MDPRGICIEIQERAGHTGLGHSGDVGSFQRFESVILDIF